MDMNEKDVDSKMFELFNIKNNWLEVYKDIKNHVDQDYINYHLNARFVYNMIKNKVDLQQFSEVMTYLYENNKREKIGSNLNDFFARRDTNIGLKQYSQLDKYNNNESFYDKMAYLFLDFDDNKPIGKKVLLDKDNLPYLLAMINVVTENTVGALCYAGYNRFIGNFVHSPEHIEPLIKIAESNKAFSKFEIGEYSNFFGNLFRDIGSNSYEEELYPNENKIIYQTLNKMVKDIDNVIVEALFRKTRNNDLEKVSMDLGIINYCLLIQSEIDIIPKINQKFQEAYAEAKSKATGDEYDDLYEYDKVISDFYSTITVSFEGHDFKLDCSNIDVNKDFRENYIYLKLIEVKIKNRQDLDISAEVCQYIKDLFQKEDNPDPTKAALLRLYGPNRILKEEIIMPYVNKYMQYKDLDTTLSLKEEIKNKKMKI